jgi:hypothetical protein
MEKKDLNYAKSGPGVANGAPPTNYVNSSGTNVHNLIDMYWGIYSMNTQKLGNFVYLDTYKVLLANTVFIDFNELCLGVMRKQLELGNYLRNRKSVSVNMLYDFN